MKIFNALEKASKQELNEKQKKQIRKKTRWIQSHNGVDQNYHSCCDTMSSGSYIGENYMKKKYKMTKKDWMELLDFWPMTIVVPIMLVLILLGPWILSWA